MSTNSLTQFEEFTAVQPVISWQDILDATKIVDDEDMGAPWKEHDGHKHHLQTVDHDDERNASGFVFTERRASRVVLDKPESWGNYQYFRAHGASKQVAAELTAGIQREAREQIARWRNYGWRWFGVWCRMKGESLDVNESLWGIQTKDDSEDDPYLQEVREEIARQAVDALETQGFFVIGVPELKTPFVPHAVANLRYNLKDRRGLNSQNYPQK